MSLQECGFSSIKPYAGFPTPESHWSKLGLRCNSSNATTCRKTHVALTSPGTGCDANFIPLLVVARVISPDSSSSCLVCDYYIMGTFVKNAL